MHLAATNEMLLQLLPLLNQLFHLFALLRTALLQVRDAPENFLQELERFFEVLLSVVGHVLKHIDLLLEIVHLLVKL